MPSSITWFAYFSIAPYFVEVVTGLTGATEGAERRAEKIKEIAANVLPDGSLSALDSEKIPSSMVKQKEFSNAVSSMVGEMRKSANPTQTATNVAKSWQQKVDKQIGSRREEVQQLVSTATKAMEAKTHEAEEFVRAAAESWSKDQVHVKKIASLVVDQMGNQSSESKFNTIWDDGQRVVHDALASAEAMRHTVQNMGDKLSKTKAEVLALGTRASDAIEAVASQSQENTEAMAIQLTEFGKLASAQLDVPDRSAQVVHETENAAGDIKAAGGKFTDESKGTAGSIQEAGYKAAAAVEALATKATASGEHRAGTIADGAASGQQALNAAREEWKRTSINALKPIYENFGQASLKQVKSDAEAERSVLAEEDVVNKSPWGDKLYILITVFMALGVVLGVIYAVVTFKKQARVNFPVPSTSLT